MIQLCKVSMIRPSKPEINCMLRTTVLIFTLLVASTGIFSQDSGLRKKNYNLEDGIAIQGYDPVAYFTGNKAVKGKKDLSYTLAGITYYFSTVQNRDLFMKTPAAYEPEYGGWCAYAMGAKGEKVMIDPGTFKILNGKLYLFYNRFFNNTLKDWNKDEAHLKSQADANWQKVNH
jgi:YHS domain-containing protein